MGDRYGWCKHVDIDGEDSGDCCGDAATCTYCRKKTCASHMEWTEGSGSVPICRQCNIQHSDDSKRCEGCDAVLEAEEFTECEYCNELNPDYPEFYCSSCIGPFDTLCPDHRETVSNCKWCHTQVTNVCMTCTYGNCCCNCAEMKLH